MPALLEFIKIIKMNELPSWAEAELLGLVEKNLSCPPERLCLLFDQCEPASSDYMLGLWQVGHFDDCLSGAGWSGKRITTTDCVDPVLYRKIDGSFYSWDIWGSALLRDMLVAGKVQACLVYRDQPWVEAFRRVSDDVVIGLLWRSAMSTSSFFWMRRMPGENSDCKSTTVPGCRTSAKLSVVTSG